MSCSCGDIADGAIWDRHVNTNADIRGTKIRVASVLERGTVTLASNLETTSGEVVQANDSRLHGTTASGATEHDTRYYTKDQLLYSGVLDTYYDNRYYRQVILNSISGASLIGVEDSHEVFTGANVEDVLYELVLKLGAQTILDLLDTPDEYPTKWFPWYGAGLAMNRAGTALIWRPKDYIDGGGFTDTYEGAKASKLEYVDAGSFTGYEIIDGGSF